MPQPAPPAHVAPAPAFLGAARAPTSIALRTLRSRGLRARLSCSRACSVSASLNIGPRTARRLRLGDGRRSVTIGRARRRLTSAGRRTLTIVLTRRARRALGRRHRTTAQLTTLVTARGARIRRTQRVTVRR